MDTLTQMHNAHPLLKFASTPPNPAEQFDWFTRVWVKHVTEVPVRDLHHVEARLDEARVRFNVVLRVLDGGARILRERVMKNDCERGVGCRTGLRHPEYRAVLAGCAWRI